MILFLIYIVAIPITHQSPTTEKWPVALKANAGVNDHLKGLSVCLGQQGN